MEKLMILFVFLISLGTYMCQELKDFDDAVLYKIDWPGNIDLQYDQNKFEEMSVTTHDGEKYRCVTPITQPRSQQQKQIDVNISPLHFISPIFSTQGCSYRIEAYWAYEICHGNHIKQYHEERDGKQVNMQEFYLGKWTDEKNEELKKKLKEDMENGKKFRTTKIDNINFPYLEVEMTGGTECDLNNNEPRSTKVRYICFPHSKNEIYSLKETSSCNYEAVILTSVLCMHPAFVPEESKENVINCLPVNNSPERPMSWLVNEIENLKYRYKETTTEGTKLKKNIAIIKINEKTGTVRMDIINGDMNEQLVKLETTNDDLDPVQPPDQGTIKKSKDPLISSTNTPKKIEKTKKLSPTTTDPTPLIEFLTGKNCLTGGTGWWKYEFCYGRFVRQYHVDNGGENSLILGVFDEKLHKEKFKRYLDRPSKSTRNDITHFYQEGTLCDKTGEKRETEVKLKCLQNSATPAQVSMYLLEPRTCHYILVVESPIICDVLQLVDENGLVPKDTFIVGNSVEQLKDSTASGQGQASNIPIEGLEVRYEND